MNSKLREFAKDSVLYSLGDWLSKLGSLILVPILSRIFLPSDYGLIDLLNTSYAFLLIVVSLNMDAGLQKFFYQREGRERNTLVSSSILFRLIFSGLISATVLISSRDLSMLVFSTSEYASVIFLLALILPMEDLYSQLMLLLRLDRKAISFSVYNISQIVISPILTYLCVVVLRQNILGVFMARFANIAIMSLLLLVQQRSYFTTAIRMREAIQLMKFSLPGLPDIVQLNIMNLLPRYLLAGFSTLTAVGLFGIADRIAKTIDMFKTAFNRAWNPFAFSNAGKEDEKYLYEKIFKLFALFLLLLVITLTFFAREILALLTPPKYHSAATLVGGLCVYYALRALTLVYSTGLYSANKVAHTSLMSTIQLAVFTSSALLLIPRFGVAGLVLSLDVAMGINFICYALTVKKYFPFKFSAYRLSCAMLLALTGVVYVYSASLSADVAVTIRQTAHKFILWLACLCTFYLIIFTKTERTRLFNAFKSLLA